jgi:hypothetical protein
MMPWAKLNTPEALKINTNPKATREYITPARVPPTTTSIKNPSSVSTKTQNPETIISIKFM